MAPHTPHKSRNGKPKTPVQQGWSFSIFFPSLYPTAPLRSRSFLKNKISLPESPISEEDETYQTATEDISSPVEGDGKDIKMASSASQPELLPGDANKGNNDHCSATTTQQTFEDFYLRQLTVEFANDLDKLRSAPDFKPDRSVPLLVRALQQGVDCFSVEDRARVVKAGSRSGL